MVVMAIQQGEGVDEVFVVDLVDLEFGEQDVRRDEGHRARGRRSSRSREWHMTKLETNVSICRSFTGS
jgi:hypothetical protein